MDKARIEYLNALAPFDHGVWEGRTEDAQQKISVGENALFKNRSYWLVNKIVSFLTNTYSASELSEMSVLEVGCYDGWVITQICQKINFKDVFGVEAREKNIKKGQVGRELAGITIPVTFIKGTAEQLEDLLPRQKFDLVICLGMLHHVSSTYDTIAALTSKSKNMLIIDSMIIPELADEKDQIEPFVNTKDITYYAEKNRWAISAFKFESPYGDGSSPKYGVVNVPSASLIEMSLYACGFGDLQKLGDETDFYDESSQSLRGVKEILAISRRVLSADNNDSNWVSKVTASEEIFCHTTLPEVIVSSLAAGLKIYAPTNEIVMAIPEIHAHFDDLVAQILTVINKGLDDDREAALLSECKLLNQEHFQLLRLIFRSPVEKSAIEIVKYFIQDGNNEAAIEILLKIIQRPSCDWWSFYRSCYLLAILYDKLGSHERKEHYLELLRLSNENFPF